MILKLDTSLQIVIAVTVILGIAYLLSTLNYIVIRALEGYPFRTQFPFDGWEQSNRNRVNIIKERLPQYTSAISFVEALLEHYVPTAASAPYEVYRDTLKSRRNELVAEQLFAYPVSEWRVLPTPLGNIIAAAEDYPQRLFGIDSVLIWPYLRPVLTQSGYAKFVEREKSVFDLLVNSLVLTTVFGLEVILIQYRFFGFSLELFGLFALFSITTVIQYVLATRAATGWASTIRGAFALHRRHLRKALGLIHPTTYSEEWQHWNKVMRFFREPLNAYRLAREETLFDYADDDESALVRVQN